MSRKRMRSLWTTASPARCTATTPCGLIFTSGSTCSVMRSSPARCGCASSTCGHRRYGNARTPPLPLMRRRATMPERTADKLHAHTIEFRARYRADMNPRYSGWLHGAFVFGVGGVLLLYCFAQITQLQWIHLPLALLALFIANVGEYMAHRQLGHVKRPIGKLFYKRHTGDHHNFFTHDDY